MATLEPACPNCGEMMLDGRSHLNCQSRRERITLLESTIGEQADQIGGLTSELERAKIEAKGNWVEVVRLRARCDAAEQVQARETALRKQVEYLTAERNAALIQLGTMQVDPEILARELSRHTTLLDIPSAAAERVQAVMAAAEIFATWSEDVWHEPWPQEIIDFRAALDTATDRNPRTVEEVPDAD